MTPRAEANVTCSSEMNETPRGARVRIAFFGRRNAGKSTLVNAFTGQNLAIVSDVPGTTTDPVSKTMEIAPIGPCLITDTAGIDDDAGALGAARVQKTREVLSATDVAVWVSDGMPEDRVAAAAFRAECAKRQVPCVTYTRGEDPKAGLVAKIVSARADAADDAPGLLEGLVKAGDWVVCVCPIDAAAPKERLILPQQQVLRAALDLHARAIVVQPDELPAVLRLKPALVVTDSQAFREVREHLARCQENVALTSFSILFARQKGDLAAFQEGLAVLETLHDGDVVLVAEGCTHHRQCGDIGTTKIPAAVKRISGGKDLKFVFSSGGSFPLEETAGVKAVVQCGGCMLTRREMMSRIARAKAAGVPIANYGMVLGKAAACGRAERITPPARDNRWLVRLDWPVDCFRFSPADKQFLEGLNVGTVDVVEGEAAFLTKLGAATHVICWEFKTAWFAQAPKLKVLMTPGAGKELTPPDDEIPAGVKMVRGTFHGAIMSESVVACLFAEARGIYAADQFQRDGVLWPRGEMSAPMHLVAGTKAVVLGFGHIGRAIGAKLEALGVKVVGIHRSNIGTLKTEVADADWLIVALPGDTGTDDLVNAEVLAAMKAGGVLVNVGRGNAVAERALKDALTCGHLKAAHLDVFKREPLTENDILAGKIRGLHRFPHCSAFSPDYIRRFIMQCTESENMI